MERGVKGVYRWRGRRGGEGGERSGRGVKVKQEDQEDQEEEERKGEQSCVFSEEKKRNSCVLNRSFFRFLTFLFSYRILSEEDEGEEKEEDVEEEQEEDEMGGKTGESCLLSEEKKRNSFELNRSFLPSIYLLHFIEYPYPGAYLSQNFWGSKQKSVSQHVLCLNDFSITYEADYATNRTN